MEAIRLANLTSSRSILFENVPGILSKRVSRDSNILIIDELRRALSSNGFPFQHETILRSEEFGVPQKRKRFFLFATREDTPFSWPRVEIDAHTTTREAFVGLPKILHNEGDPQNSYNGESGAYADLMTNGRFWRLKKKTDYPSYHIAPNHRPGTIERYKLIKPGEGLKDLFEKLSDGERKNLQSQRILPKKWYIQRNRRLQWDRPSPTITSHCIDELIHPKLHRAPTVREVARLQSFPDLYVFPGGPVICPHIYETQDKYEQVGDAVPPLMAYYLGCAIKLALG
jgi:DNA (cytosine-5)-methyltransferase 1